MDKDAVNKRYFSDNRRYADLINGFIFQGRQEVSAEALSDMDTQTGIWGRSPRGGEGSGKKGKRKKGQGRKYRDLVRKVAFGINFAVVGAEKQEEVHYLMPLRGMGYDVAEYERQARMIGKAVKEEGGVSKAEFLSGFKKNSKLSPCITLVLFFGKEWDGGKELYDILDFTGIPEELKGMVNNYTVHVLEVRKLESTDMFRTDLKQVFDFIRHSEDKEKLQELVENDAAYREMDEDAYDMVVAYIDAEELVSMKKYKGKEGKVDMCKAIKELIEDGRKEGMERGLEQGIEQGLSQGLKRGSERINSLNLRLSEDGRMDDLLKSFRDAMFQKRLLDEYRL